VDIRIGWVGVGELVKVGVRRSCMIKEWGGVVWLERLRGREW
jgi:hypothetical protein